MIRVFVDDLSTASRTAVARRFADDRQSLAAANDAGRLTLV